MSAIGPKRTLGDRPRHFQRTNLTGYNALS
jgi:hypothetical protein